MDDDAQRRVEPTENEQQHNREREMMGFSLGLWAVAAVVVVIIVIGALFLI